MIAAVIRWSARNVFLIGLATMFVTLAGIYAVSRVPLDAIPDLSDCLQRPESRRRWFTRH